MGWNPFKAVKKVLSKGELPLKMDMDLLNTFTQEEYDLLVDTLTKHRWENHND